MKSSVEPLEGNKVKLYVEVDETEFDKDIDLAFKAIAREVKLPGFRNGKAPRRLLEARIGVGPAREQALRDAIPKYVAQAVQEHEIDLIATPEVEVTGGEDEGLVEFEAECEVRPVITVPGYGGLRIEVTSPHPTDDELEQARAAELKAHGTLIDVERPIESGDYLTLDLVGTRDGEPAPGLNTEGWSYEIGQGWVSDDFDDHLIGAKVGDVVEFTTTPKGTEEEADLSVTIESVQVLELPEVTDEWVADTIGEFETIADWEAALSERVTESKLMQTRQEVMPKLITALVALVDIDAPEPMVQAEMNNRLQNLVRQLQAQGIDIDAWLSATGQSPQQLLEGTRPQAEEAAKADLALRAVAVAEDLEVTDDDIEAEYARMAMQFGQKASQIRRLHEQNGAVPELRAQILKNKAIDWLLDRVEIVDEAGQVLDSELIMGPSQDDGSEEDEA